MAGGDKAIYGEDRRWERLAFLSPSVPSQRVLGPPFYLETDLRTWTHEGLKINKPKPHLSAVNIKSFPFLHTIQLFYFFLLTLNIHVKLDFTVCFLMFCFRFPVFSAPEVKFKVQFHVFVSPALVALTAAAISLLLSFFHSHCRHFVLGSNAAHTNSYCVAGLKAKVLLLSDLKKK